MSDNEYKNCPFCDEEIKSVAVKCRYCKSMLVDENNSQDQDSQKEFTKDIKLDNNLQTYEHGEHNREAISSSVSKTSKKKPKIHKGFYIVAGLLLVIIVIIALNSVSNGKITSNQYSDRIAKHEIRGNTAGNLVNGGFAAIHDDWVYYTDYFDNPNEASIYRISTDESMIEHVIKDNFGVGNLNIVYDWIYYTNINGISKVRTDGSGHEQIINNLKKEGGLILAINVIGDWIYYINSIVDDGESQDYRDWKFNGEICKVRTDGSEYTLLVEDQASGLNVIDGWIYYSNLDDKDKIFKIRVDGSGRTKVNNDKSKCLNVVDDWIYYINIDDSTMEIPFVPVIGSIYKINTDGSGRKKIMDVEANSINVDNGWIYYTNWSDFGNLSRIFGNICRVRLDGSEHTTINNDISSHINLVDGWIYYLDQSYGYAHYRIRTDGSGNAKIGSIKLSPKPTFDQKENIVVVNVPEYENLNLRSGPGTNHSILAKLKRGTELVVLNETTGSDGDQWLEVVTPDGIKGWVNKGYVTKIIQTNQLTGSISGALGFPSEHTPKLRVVAFNYENGNVYYIDTSEGQEFYQMDGMPPGTYYVVAYDNQGYAGGYTQFVLDGLMYGFDDHTLIPVTVYAGNVTQGIDTADWTAPQGTFPPMP